MQHARQVRDLMGALTPGCQPLEGKSFYLDTTKSRTSALLTEVIRRLGGKVESFLNKDVSVVVTGEREAVADRPRGGSPAGLGGTKKDIITSAQSQRESRRPAGQYPGTPRPLVCGSRGKALLEKAIRNNERSQGSVLASARSWGVKIVNVDDFLMFIDRLTAEKPRDKSRKSEKKTDAPATRIVKAGVLKSPYIKVEDSSRRYRPLHSQSLTFPMLSYTGKFSPFQPPAPPRPGKRKEKECRSEKLREEPISSDDKHSTRLLRTPSPKQARKKSLGYCECCQVPYKDQDEHLQSNQHSRFVQNKSNYAVVDQLVEAMDATFKCDTDTKPALMSLQTAEHLSPSVELEQHINSETEQALQILLNPSTALQTPDQDIPINIQTTDDRTIFMNPDPNQHPLNSDLESLSLTTPTDHSSLPATVISPSPVAIPCLQTDFSPLPQPTSPCQNNTSLTLPLDAHSSSLAPNTLHQLPPLHCNSNELFPSPSNTADSSAIPKTSIIAKAPSLCSAPHEGEHSSLGISKRVDVPEKDPVLQSSAVSVQQTVTELVDSDGHQTEDEDTSTVCGSHLPSKQLTDDSVSVIGGQGRSSMDLQQQDLPSNTDSVKESQNRMIRFTDLKSVASCIPQCQPCVPLQVNLLSTKSRKRSRSFSLSPKPNKRMRTDYRQGQWSDPTHISSDATLKVNCQLISPTAFPRGNTISDTLGTLDVDMGQGLLPDKQALSRSVRTTTVTPKDQYASVTEYTQPVNSGVSLAVQDDQSAHPYQKEVPNAECHTVAIDLPSSELGPPELYPFYHNDSPLDSDGHQQQPCFLEPPELFPAYPPPSPTPPPPEKNHCPPVSLTSNTSLLSHSVSSVCIDSALLPDFAAHSPSSSESDWDCAFLSRLGPSAPVQPKGKCYQTLDLELLLQRSCAGAAQDGSYETQLFSVLQPVTPPSSLCGEEMVPKPLCRSIETCMDRRLIQGLEG